MATKKARSLVIQNIEDAGVEEALQLMEDDSTLMTNASYSANVARYPDHKIPFKDKHINFLIDHPNVDLDQYLSNLRLIITIR